MITTIKSILERLGLKQTVKSLMIKPPHIDIEEVKLLLGLNPNDLKNRHTTVESLEAYNDYIQANESYLHRQFMLEQKLVNHFKKPFTIGSGSFINGEKETYLIHCSVTEKGVESNLRETCIDSKNGLNSRIRATLYVCFARYSKQELQGKRIYLTEAVTPLFNYLKSNFIHVEGSEFLDADLASGALVNGVRHEDITGMSYGDEQFDIGFCLEVLEHVPDYKKAFTELARITKKGGSFFITVPFLEKSEQTLIRARLKSDGVIEHLLTPEYHGDPVNADGGILCFQHFSWDIGEALKASGFSKIHFHFIRSWDEVILGYHMLVIEAIK
jgi:SAM-dependent methyltransferase